jgi:hypothetical protein
LFVFPSKKPPIGIKTTDQREQLIFLLIDTQPDFNRRFSRFQRALAFKTVMRTMTKYKEQQGEKLKAETRHIKDKQHAMTSAGLKAFFNIARDWDLNTEQ